MVQAEELTATRGRWRFAARRVRAAHFLVCPHPLQKISANRSLPKSPMHGMMALRPSHHLPKGRPSMNQLTTEPLSSLADLADSLPEPNGRKTSRSTVLRWVKRGVRGIKLEAVRLGNVWLSSREALQRFLDRLSS